MRWGALLFSLFMAQEAAAEARDARVMLTAFSCFQLAQMTGQHDTSIKEAHFQAGYDAGKRFLIALQGGQINDEDLQVEVPVGIALNLSGPSHDFIIGRIFEVSTSLTFDNVVKKDSNGITMPVERWINDPELEAAVARAQYEEANCYGFR